MHHLIEQIITICTTHPADEARHRLAALFDQEAMAAVLAPAIKVTGKGPGQTIPQSNPTFKPVGTGRQSGTGKAYTLYELLDGTIIGRPHDNGKPLTDDEIAATVSKWNKEAAEIVRASRP